MDNIYIILFVSSYILDQVHITRRLEKPLTLVARKWPDGGLSRMMFAERESAGIGSKNFIEKVSTC